MASTKATGLMNVEPYFGRSRLKKIRRGQRRVKRRQSITRSQWHFDGSELNAELAAIHCTTMFSTNAIPTPPMLNPNMVQLLQQSTTSCKPKPEPAHQAPSQANQNKDDEDHYRSEGLIRRTREGGVNGSR
jgi:hypothetical protein